MKDTSHYDRNDDKDERDEGSKEKAKGVIARILTIAMIIAGFLAILVLTTFNSAVNTWCVLTPFYRVAEKWGVVYTRLNGDKGIQQEAGFHPRYSLKKTPILTLKAYDLRKRSVFLHNDPTEHPIQAKDEQIFRGKGFFEVRTVDLYAWAIDSNEERDERFEGALTALAMNVIQANEVRDIVGDRKKIQDDVNEILNNGERERFKKDYGQLVLVFYFPSARYSDEMITIMASGKRRKIEADNNLAAAEKDMKAFKLRFSGHSQAFNDAMKEMGITDPLLRLEYFKIYDRIYFTQRFSEKGASTIIERGGSWPAPLGLNFPVLEETLDGPGSKKK